MASPVQAGFAFGRASFDVAVHHSSNGLNVGDLSGGVGDSRELYLWSISSHRWLARPSP